MSAVLWTSVKMDRIRMLRLSLELKFIAENLMKQSRTGWFAQVLEGIKMEGKSFQKVKRERYGKREETGEFLCIDIYKMEIMLEE